MRAAVARKFRQSLRVAPDSLKRFEGIIFFFLVQQKEFWNRDSFRSPGFSFGRVIISLAVHVRFESVGFGPRL